MIRRDWSIKPSGAMFRDLVFDKWWTREEGRTDDAGHFSTRGFLGEYMVRVAIEEKEFAVPFVLDGHGSRLNIVVTESGEITTQ